MNDQANNTPLLELARAVPKELRAEWETQWFDDGTPCGHSMAPIGRYVHELADEIDKLRADNELLRTTALRADNIEKHRDELATEVDKLRAALQNIIDYHDTNGEYVITCARIAKEALKGGEDE